MASHKGTNHPIRGATLGSTNTSRFSTMLVVEVRTFTRKKPTGREEKAMLMKCEGCEKRSEVGPLGTAMLRVDGTLTGYCTVERKRVAQTPIK